MKRYKTFIREHLACFILAPLFMVLEASGEFILPFINANIIDKGAATGDIPYILKNGVYMLLLAVGMLITGVLGANFAIRGGAHLAADIRKETFSRIQTYSFSDIDRFTTGSLITRLTNDTNQIQTFTQQLLRGSFRSPVMLIGALVMSFMLNRELAWILLIVTPLLALAIYFIIRTASPRYTTMQEQLDGLNNGVSEAIVGEKLIKSFVREDFEKEKFRGLNTNLMDKTERALKVMIFMQPVSAFAINLTTLLVVWFSGKQIMVGKMEIGTLTAFITYLTQVLNALNFLANVTLSGARAQASNRRIAEVLDNTPDIRDDDATQKDFIITQGSIEFDNVSFRYYKNNEQEILDHVSFTVKPGAMVGIIGATGSGKTTLVSLIPRLYDPDEGEVRVDGVPVKELSLKHLRDSVAVVLQKNTLFSGTIAENLRWGKPDATDEELRRVCQIAHADEFIDGFPEGYETELGQGGSGLSGGQRQRLCIARALLKNPRILILDDSTSAVDTATEAGIRRAFREDLTGLTKIIIAQRITSVADADLIVVMDGGRIQATGKHEELMKTSSIYRDIYFSQKDEEDEI